MRQHGLEPYVLPGGMTEDDGAAAIARLDTARGITAVVCFNDRTAVGVLDVLARRGVSVPDAISVAGFDDSVQARHALINLTTVDQSSAQQARLAVEAVMERLDGDRTQRREIVLPARLIVRGTTGPVARSTSS